MTTITALDGSVLHIDDDSVSRACAMRASRSSALGVAPPPAPPTRQTQ